MPERTQNSKGCPCIGIVTIAVDDDLVQVKK